MSELVIRDADPLLPSLTSAGLPALPWRDPHTVPLEQRQALVQSLKEACEKNPESADLRTYLAMAHAVDYAPYESLDALTEALKIDPKHFFAQLKLAEMWYRLRAIVRAEEECLKALQLAANPSQYRMARAQLQEIRRIANNSYARPTWNKPMLPAALFMVAVFVLLGVIGLWR